jgi:hypothetical protein
MKYNNTHKITTTIQKITTYGGIQAVRILNTNENSETYSSEICVASQRKYTDPKATDEKSGFGGLEVACWPLVPKFAGLHPAEAVGFLGRKKSPSFGGEVKPSVPCRSFTACKRYTKSSSRQNYRTFLAHSSTFRRWVLSRGDTHGDAW